MAKDSNTDSNAAPNAPKKRHLVRNFILGLVAFIAIIVIIETASSSGSKNASSPSASSATTASGNSSPASTTPPTTAAPATTTSSGPKTSFADGTWQVGKQIAAGTYETSGGSGCYWQRVSDMSGSFGSILANDTISGHDVVTILPTDVGFQTQGCGTWSPVPASGAQKTSFGDGMWAVAVDIAPGTYQTSGGSSCYWERDSAFTGDPGAILANDTPSGPVTVTIQPTDKGFKTQGCGTWTKA